MGSYVRLRARLYLLAHDLEQNLRRLAPVRGQNWAPQHTQVTTVPRRRARLLSTRVWRMASRPAGEWVMPARSRASVARAGSRLEVNFGLSAKRSFALAAMVS